MEPWIERGLFAYQVGVRVRVRVMIQLHQHQVGTWSWNMELFPCTFFFGAES